LYEKTQIKDTDEISIGKTDFILKIKFINFKRERSRSPNTEQIIKKHDNNDEKSETESNNKNKHIKSEVVWNAVNFENKNKKEKFLRLMGAYKGKDLNSVSQSEATNNKLSEELTKNFKKIESDLTNQFYQTIGRKYNISK